MGRQLARTFVFRHIAPFLFTLMKTDFKNLDGGSLVSDKFYGDFCDSLGH